jgi:hypothetical protein
VIPKAWHWRAADGAGGTKHDVSPKLTASGDLDESGPGGVLLPANTRNWGHRLLRSIPIRKEGASTSYQPEFREPFVLAYRDTAPTGYFYVDQPSSLDDIPGSVRMLDADFGFEVRMSPRHQLAKNHWGGATASLTLLRNTTGRSSSPPSPSRPTSVSAPRSMSPTAMPTASWRSTSRTPRSGGSPPTPSPT